MKISFTGLHGLSLWENQANLRDLIKTEEVLASANQAFNRIDLNSGDNDVFLKTEKGVDVSKNNKSPYIDILIINNKGENAVHGTRIYTMEENNPSEKTVSRYIAQSFKELGTMFPKKQANDFDLRVDNLFETYA